MERTRVFEKSYSSRCKRLPKTVNHYMWQDNATYKNSNFVSLPVYSMLKDGSGCEAAKTSYGTTGNVTGLPLPSSSVKLFPES